MYNSLVRTIIEYGCPVWQITPTENMKKLELWVTSVTDTPRLQYYGVQTLEYRYISKLPMKNELTKNIHLEGSPQVHDPPFRESISWIISPSKC